MWSELTVSHNLSSLLFCEGECAGEWIELKRP
jgi:hypothetical protein